MSVVEEPMKFDATVLAKMATCDTHGEYASKGILGGRIWTQCPICSEVRSAKQKEEEEAKEAAEIKFQWERRLGHACIPERYQDRSFDNFIVKNSGQQHALDISRAFAEGFAENKGRSLIFCGLPGTGKTHLANAICLHVMEHGNRTSAMFTTVMKAIRRIKETWSRKSDETETDAIDAFVYPNLLVLDEIGVQFGSETEKQLLFDILNERYEQRKPTILISNLPVKEVIAFIGERVFDRLKEDKGQSVVFDWKSQR